MNSPFTRALHPFIALLFALILGACTTPRNTLQGSASYAPQPVIASEIGKGVYVISGIDAEPSPANAGRVANAAFIVGPNGIIAWNAGTSLKHGRDIIAAIRAVSAQPIRLLIISHPYQDRLFGASAFSEIGVPIWMHQASRDLMRTRCEQCLQNLQKLLGANEMAGSILPTPDRVFDKDETINLIGRPLRLLAPAWSSGPGDTALFDVESGILFAGVIVTVNRIPDLRDAKFESWRNALRGLTQLPITRVLSDYGALGIAKDVMHTDRYLEQLGRSVEHALRAGVSLTDIAKHTALPEFSNWYGYPDIHRRNVQKIYLEREYELFEQPETPTLNKMLTK